MGSRTNGGARMRQSLGRIWDAAWARRDRETRQAARKEKKIGEFPGPFHALSVKLGMSQERITEIMEGCTPSKAERKALQAVVN